MASVVTDLLVEVIISPRIPERLRPLQVFWVVSNAFYLLGLAALTATRRHELKEGVLFLRSPLGAEVEVPVEIVRSVEVSHRLNKGYGYRRSRETPQALVFSPGNATTAVIDLNEAVRVRQKDGDELEVTRFLVAFDDPQAARRAITRSKEDARS
ncbi:hypothetical protein ACFYY8_00890 [Streptosporangium sp. NPDC001559]|uniref:hypothetical protein n=1 Tax=Streptosporangium sp. NPDC001559 TaxID=3366187 RepID=UPI0036E26749